MVDQPVVTLADIYRQQRNDLAAALHDAQAELFILRQQLGVLTKGDTLTAAPSAEPPHDGVAPAAET